MQDYLNYFCTQQQDAAYRQNKFAEPYAVFGKQLHATKSSQQNIEKPCKGPFRRENDYAGFRYDPVKNVLHPAYIRFFNLYLLPKTNQNPLIQSV